MLLSYESNRVILQTRYVQNSLSDSSHAEVIKRIDDIQAGSHFKQRGYDIINTTSGSSIKFRGIKQQSADQTAKLKSIEGLTDWILEEAEELTDESIFDKIDLSVRVKGVQNRVILVLNPSTKEHFIYERFFAGRGVDPGFNGTKGDATYIHTTYLDNIENLSESYLLNIRKIEENNPKKFNHIIMGGWLEKAEGVIYENWETGEFNEEAPTIIFGQDYGYSVDPTVLIKVGIDEKREIVWVKECFYKAGLNTTQIAELNLRHAKGELIVADSAEPRLIDELRRAKCNMRKSIKGADSVRSGIKRLQDYKMIVDPQSKNIIKELNLYQWDDRKSQIPVDRNNHALDAIRYAVTARNKNYGKYIIGAK